MLLSIFNLNYHINAALKESPIPSKEKANLGQQLESDPKQANTLKAFSNQKVLCLTGSVDSLCVEVKDVLECRPLEDQIKAILGHNADLAKSNFDSKVFEHLGNSKIIEGLNRAIKEKSLHLSSGSCKYFPSIETGGIFHLSGGATLYSLEKAKRWMKLGDTDFSKGLKSCAELMSHTMVFRNKMSDFFIKEIGLENFSKKFHDTFKETKKPYDLSEVYKLFLETIDNKEKTSDLCKTVRGSILEQLKARFEKQANQKDTIKLYANGEKIRKIFDKLLRNSLIAKKADLLKFLQSKINGSKPYAKNLMDSYEHMCKRIEEFHSLFRYFENINLDEEIETKDSLVIKLMEQMVNKNPNLLGMNKEFELRGNDIGFRTGSNVAILRENEVFFEHDNLVSAVMIETSSQGVSPRLILAPSDDKKNPDNMKVLGKGNLVLSEEEQKHTYMDETQFKSFLQQNELSKIKTGITAKIASGTSEEQMLLNVAASVEDIPIKETTSQIQNLSFPSSGAHLSEVRSSVFPCTTPCTVSWGGRCRFNFIPVFNDKDEICGFFVKLKGEHDEIETSIETLGSKTGFGKEETIRELLIKKIVDMSSHLDPFLVENEKWTKETQSLKDAEKNFLKNIRETIQNEWAQLKKIGENLSVFLSFDPEQIPLEKLKEGKEFFFVTRER